MIKHSHHLKTIIFILLGVCLLADGCQKEMIKPVQLEYPTVAEIKEGMYTITNDSDAMFLGHLEYESSNGDLVIDPHYYQANEANRGDVIYYETPSGYKVSIKNNIGRIVGLPNEKLEIRKGQIYINHKKLETFYGKAISDGLYKKDYIKMRKSIPNSECSKICMDSTNEIFDLSLKEIQIPSDAVFVIGDNWMRSFDSRFFGTLPLEKIIGKVLGYQEKIEQ